MTFLSWRCLRRRSRTFSSVWRSNDFDELESCYVDYRAIPNLYRYDNPNGGYLRSFKDSLYLRLSYIFNIFYVMRSYNLCPLVQIGISIDRSTYNMPQVSGNV